MTDDTITISAGRPERQGDEKDFSGPDGTYPVILSSVSDVIDEASRQPRTLRNGKPDPHDDGRWVYRIWTFAFENDENQGEVLDKRVNARSNGPKSGQFGIIAALLGRTPAANEVIKIPELVGRSALVSILTKEGTDYPYIADLIAAPRTTPQTRIEQAQAVSASIESRQMPAQPAQPIAPAPQPVAAGSELPF